MATRVAIILSEGIDAKGGIGRVVTYLTRAIRSVAPDIHPLVLRSRWSQAPILKHLTIPFALASFLVHVLARRIDVVHVNVAPRGSTWRKLLYERAARMVRRPVILHLHGSGYDGYYAGLDPRRRAAVRSFFGRAAAVVVLSDFWQRFAVDTLGVDPARVAQIPNGVPEVARTPARAENPVPVIAFLGVVGHRKGADILIEALAGLSAKSIAWRAVVGGDGDVAKAIAQATALGIADRISFLGWVGEAEVDDVLRSADIFVLPSRAENQPVAILEAMAHALPVVATRVGAIPEQVVDGVTGLLVDPGDAAQLERALAALAIDPARRARYGEAALARFERHFSATACAERFAALYRRVRR